MFKNLKSIENENFKINKPDPFHGGYKKNK